jgi:hypothetical protein
MVNRIIDYNPNKTSQEWYDMINKLEIENKQLNASKIESERKLRTNRTMIQELHIYIQQTFCYQIEESFPPE